MGGNSRLSLFKTSSKRHLGAGEGGLKVKTQKLRLHLFSLLFLFLQNLGCQRHQENHREHYRYDAYLVHYAHVEVHNCDDGHKHQRQDEGFLNAAEHFRSSKTHEFTPAFPKSLHNGKIKIFCPQLIKTGEQIEDNREYANPSG
jgi:hypothetical protein